VNRFSMEREAVRSEFTSMRCVGEGDLGEILGVRETERQRVGERDESKSDSVSWYDVQGQLE